MTFNKIILTCVAILSSGLLSAAELEAQLDWANKVVLGFAVPGVVLQVKVLPGQTVNKKQQLVLLDQQPFKIQLSKARGGIARMQSLLFDAQLEFDHAQELFDRTVLSQVELQQTQAKLKALKAEESMAKADEQRAIWDLAHSQLLAPFDGRVVINPFKPGLVISEYNKAGIQLELVAMGKMLARFKLPVDQTRAVKINQPMKIKIYGDVYSGLLKSISNDSLTSDYQLVVEFSHALDKQYLAGQKATVVY